MGYLPPTHLGRTILFFGFFKRVITIERMQCGCMVVVNYKTFVVPLMSVSTSLRHVRRFIHLERVTRVSHAGQLSRYLRIKKIKFVLIKNVINYIQSTTQCLKLIIHVNNVIIKSISVNGLKQPMPSLYLWCSEVNLR